MLGRISREFKRGSALAWRGLRFGVRKPREAWLLARMGLWVVALSLLVKLMPLPRVLKLMTPGRRRAPAGQDPSETRERLAAQLDMLLRVDLWVFTPTCWKRAPVLYRYLALRGVETRVVFGMRREGEGAVAGHAWLEAGGEPVLEENPPAYAVTYVFPPAAGSRV